MAIIGDFLYHWLDDSPLDYIASSPTNINALWII